MRRLFIMRPEPGASATVRDAAKLGLDAVAMPLFSVKPLAWNTPDPTEYDALLLTSANAVRYGGQGLRHLRGLPVHAVGKATAAAAQEAGLSVASVGDFGIERLLAFIDPDLRLLHLCGEHRSPAQAGRSITPIPVYASTLLPVPVGLAAIDGQTVAIHSPRAGRRLSELTVQERVDRSTVRLVAISETAAFAAGDGWEVCETTDRPDSSTLLALAARLCDKPGRP